MLNLSKRDVIIIFLGIRVIFDIYDFIIEEDEDVKNFINVVGIELLGFILLVVIGRYIVELVSDKLNVKRNFNFNFYREDIKRFLEFFDEEREEMIKFYLIFGNIVCRCEFVFEYEIVEVIKRGVKILDSIKRRIRVGMGRC